VLNLCSDASLFYSLFFFIEMKKGVNDIVTDSLCPLSDSSESNVSNYSIGAGGCILGLFFTFFLKFLFIIILSG
jgi:hypothetical protein